jgi:hypothetical protein
MRPGGSFKTFPNFPVELRLKSWDQRTPSLKDNSVLSLHTDVKGHIDHDQGFVEPRGYVEKKSTFWEAQLMLAKQVRE